MPKRLVQLLEALGFIVSQQPPCLHQLVTEQELSLMGKSKAFDEQFMRDKLAQYDILNKFLPENTLICFTIAGYNDDPREVHEIPELRAFLAEWALMTGVLQNKSLSPISRDVFARCIGFAP